ncbi:MAG TPA: MBL fold metallo-hydrolase [Solirubrobacterales bacterium]|nr:MBL fold metallo-hydrolase [Solirubrobacterales bacterium]
MNRSEGERLRWLGHATVLLELGGARLLTDPLLRRRLWHLSRRGPVPAVGGPVDGVLISHVHRDHLDLRSLAGLEGAPTVLGPRGLGDLLHGRGMGEIVELEEGESASIAGVRVIATAARHPARRGRRSPWVPSLGFVVEAGSRIYFAGDSDIYPEMAQLAPVDVALLPVWGWGPKLGTGHMNPRSAAQALQLLRPRVAVPIHWGTYWPTGWGGPRLIEPPREFARHAGEVAPQVEVRILSQGETLELD